MSYAGRGLPPSPNVTVGEGLPLSSMCKRMSRKAIHTFGLTTSPCPVPLLAVNAGNVVGFVDPGVSSIM